MGRQTARQQIATKDGVTCYLSEDMPQEILNTLQTLPRSPGIPDDVIFSGDWSYSGAEIAVRAAGPDAVGYQIVGHPEKQVPIGALRENLASDWARHSQGTLSAAEVAAKLRGLYDVPDSIRLEWDPESLVGTLVVQESLYDDYGLPRPRETPYVAHATMRAGDDTVTVSIDGDSQPGGVTMTAQQARNVLAEGQDDSDSPRNAAMYAFDPYMLAMYRNPHTKPDRLVELTELYVYPDDRGLSVSFFLPEVSGYDSLLDVELPLGSDRAKFLVDGQELTGEELSSYAYSVLDIHDMDAAASVLEKGLMAARNAISRETKATDRFVALRTDAEALAARIGHQGATVSIDVSLGYAWLENADTGASEVIAGVDQSGRTVIARGDLNDVERAVAAVTATEHQARSITQPSHTTREVPSAPFTVYSVPDCMGCKATMRALDKAGVDYDVVDLSQNPDLAASLKEQGHRQAPVLEGPGGETVSGYRPDRIKAMVEIATSRAAGTTPTTPDQPRPAPASPQQRGLAL